MAVSEARTQAQMTTALTFFSLGHCLASEQKQQGAFLTGNSLACVGGQSHLGGFSCCSLEHSAHTFTPFWPGDTNSA